MPLTEIHANILTEADRIMTICNACRYCEGHCAVFPAMAKRLEFNQGNLEYLANLCHGCGSCYHHCQYAEPHEFNVNVPRTFAELRKQTYAEYAWPGFMRLAFDKNGVWVAAILCLSLVGFILGAAWLTGPDHFFAVHENKFYGVIPHKIMAGLFTGVSLFVLLALTMGAVNYWRSLGLPSPLGIDRRNVFQALHNALTLKYLDGGGGDGCTYPDERPSLARRRFHHLTFYGFMLCFAATLVGTLYHYGFGWQAPYDLLSLPKVLGIAGGIGLIVGPVGLLWLKNRADEALRDQNSSAMDLAFLILLLLTSATGLVLMVVGDTSFVGLALAVHLGAILALFITMPYGKFVHGIYRFITLVAHAMEQRDDSIIAGREKME